MSAAAQRDCAPVSPDINAFVFSHARLPWLGDAIPPWRYRGWLLYQVQLADLHPKLPGRWDHYMRTLEAGKLLDEPIPQVRFTAGPSPSGWKMLEKCLQHIQRRESAWSAFQVLVDWLAWGLAVCRDEPRLEETTNEALYRTFDLEPLLTEPHDYLGSILSDRRSGGWNPHAFFPTPHPVSEFMVELNFGGGSGGENGRDARLQTVLDPAVGSGRLLLHASNYSYCLYGCDIDPLVARINGALYAPWLAFPFPEYILGVSVPPPPPAPLPLPPEHQSPAGEPQFRCDDRGQGLLNFD